MNIVLIIIAAIVIVMAVVMSVNIVNKQQSKEFDNDPARAVVKHPIMANRIFMIYAAGIAIIIIGAVIWGFMRM